MTPLALLDRVLPEGTARRLARPVAGGVAAYVCLQLLWPAPLGVVVQGVLVGALGSLLALGLALVYRANRIVNFAQADLGAVPGVLTLLLLRAQGWNYYAAVVAGLAVALLLGAVVQRLFVKRFSAAPRLILTVVTIGVSQILVAASAILPKLMVGDNFNVGTIKPPFSLTLNVEPIIFRGNDVLALMVVPPVILALFAFLRFTSVGVAIRASAESADRATLLGIPVDRVQTVVWMVAAALSFIALFLRNSALGFSLGGTSGGAVTLAGALAAAVIGRLENFGVILVASLGLGVLTQAIIWDTGSVRDSIPVTFLIILAALLLQHRGRRARTEDGDVSTWKAVATARPIPSELAALPEVRWARRLTVWAFIAVGMALPMVVGTARTSLAALVWVYALLGVSLVILTGWAGQISLGQAAFFGLGGAVGGALTIEREWDLAAVLLVAGVAGGVAAVAVGLPALRIKGLYLAVTTLSFAVLISTWFINKDVMHWVPAPADFVLRRPLFGRIDITGERAYYYVCFGCLLVAMWMMRGVRNSRTGRVLVATRDNERASQSYGINATRAKLTAFAISGFLAAAAGVLYVHSQQALSAPKFAPAESLRVFTMVVIGGMGSIPGAILGSLYLNGTQWFTNSLPQEWMRTVASFSGTGFGVILVLLFLPGGLGSVLYRSRDRVLRLVSARRGIVVPSLVADVAPLPERAVARQLGERGDTGGGDAHLVVRGLEAGYDGVQVLFGVDLAVRRGEIVALLGTNGAGKSTVLRAVSSLMPAMGGQVLFEGTDLSHVAAHEIARLGVGHVPGGRGIFPSLTVAENLRMATWTYRRDRAAVREATDDALTRFPGLREKLGVHAGDLSGGQQQMLTLAQTFMTKPSLIMIDELSLGLAPIIVEQLAAAVRDMRDDGVTVVLVEQSVNVALTMADRAYFLEKGEVRFHGPTSELLDRPDIMRSVFVQGAAAAGGTKPARPAAARPSERRRGAEPPPPGPALQVTGLTRSFGGVVAVDDVSFTVEAGRTLGIIGPNGAGKTTVFDLISGFTAADRGEVVLAGRAISGLAPDARARRGLGRSFQDARLFPSLTVAETIAVALELATAERDPLAAALGMPSVLDSEEDVRTRVDELVELMSLQAFRDKFIGELSTGSRRIVDLACVLAHRPTVLMLDEPSSGIAQREAEALGPLLGRIRQETGATLLVIEHDMPLISAVSDELLAMETGRVLVRGTPSEVLGDHRVIESYLGTSDAVIARSGNGAPARPARRPLRHTVPVPSRTNQV